MYSNDAEVSLKTGNVLSLETAFTVEVGEALCLETGFVVPWTNNGEIDLAVGKILALETRFVVEVGEALGLETAFAVPWLNDAEVSLKTGNVLSLETAFTVEVGEALCLETGFVVPYSNSAEISFSIDVIASGFLSVYLDTIAPVLNITAPVSVVKGEDIAVHVTSSEDLDNWQEVVIKDSAGNSHVVTGYFVNKRTWQGMISSSVLSVGTALVTASFRDEVHNDATETSSVNIARSVLLRMKVRVFII